MRTKINSLPTYMNRAIRTTPWGGGARFLEKFTEKLWKTDIGFDPPEGAVMMFCLGLDKEDGNLSIEEMLEYKRQADRTQLTPIPLVLRVNDNDARKGTKTVDERMLRLSRYLDGTVFVSDWQREYFSSRGWECRHNVVVVNGVDHEVFKPSAHEPSSPQRLVTHHWSNNHMKGFDVYESLDREVPTGKFTFKYVGRDRGTFKNSTTVRPCMGETLARELSSCDVYVSASRYDPGPNHVLEALACGLPTYVHVDGGGCVEFAGVDHAFSSYSELLEKLKDPRPNDRAVRLLPWEDSCKTVYEFLLNLAERMWR